MRIFLAICFAFLSSTSFAQPPGIGNPVEDSLTVLKDSASFARYYQSLRLSEDFIAYDVQFNKISKEELLFKIYYESYFPLQLQSKDTLAYKLYKTNVPDNYLNPTVLKTIAYYQYTHFMMEG